MAKFQSISTSVPPKILISLRKEAAVEPKSVEEHA